MTLCMNQTIHLTSLLKLEGHLMRSLPKIWSTIFPNIKQSSTIVVATEKRRLSQMYLYFVFYFTAPSKTTIHCAYNMKWLPGRKSDIQILPNGTIVTQIRTKWYNCYINSDKMVHLLYGHVTIVPFWQVFRHLCQIIQQITNKVI